MMLGSSPRVAVQDPSYPVYVDTSVIMGMTGDYNQDATNFHNVQYMPCTPDNGFFPDLSVVSRLHMTSVTVFALVCFTVAMSRYHVTHVEGGAAVMLRTFTC